MSKKFDLEDRLIDFSVSIINFVKQLPKDYLSMHITQQIIRSSTSPASNYAEAQGAESRADFVHKMKLSLKELRETKVWLKLIKKANLLRTTKNIDSIIRESNELISIFVKSISTAQNKN